MVEVDAQGEYWMRSVIEATGKRSGNGKGRAPSSAPPVKRRKRTPVVRQTIE